MSEISDIESIKMDDYVVSPRKPKKISVKDAESSSSDDDSSFESSGSEDKESVQAEAAEK